MTRDHYKGIPKRRGTLTSSNITDNQIVRGDGFDSLRGQGVQGSLPLVDDSGNIIPPVNSTLNIGTAALRFQAVFAEKLVAHNSVSGTVTISPDVGALVSDFGVHYQNYLSTKVYGNGSVALGKVARANGYPGSGTATLKAGFDPTSTYPSFAMGSSFATGAYSSLIDSQYPGAFALGATYAYNANATLRAYGRGAHAIGYAKGYTGPGIIQATGAGSFAGGYATNGIVSAANIAAFAFGSINGSYVVTASGRGSFAMGYTSTASIEAMSTNSGQFGPGTNSLQDSFQVGGAGIRLKGTVNAPASPQNGDMWIDGSGNVFVRSNGVSKNLSNIT